MVVAASAMAVSAIQQGRTYNRHGRRICIGVQWRSSEVILQEVACRLGLGATMYWAQLVVFATHDL